MASEEFTSLLKENQELKQKYENAVADYETTRFEKEQLNSLVNSCQEEIRRLKKQLKNYKKLGFKHLQDKNNDLETQQKEFITYLEDEIKNTQIKWGNKLTEKGYIDIATTVRAYQIILQKYKEIIGGKDEDNKQ